MSTYRRLQIVSVLLPVVLIGGFEYIRHDYLLQHMSMEFGNLLITLLTFVLSLLYSIWMFRKLTRYNTKLAREQSRRAVYEERERLARELHDGIAQSLFYLNVKLKKGQVEEARTALSSIDNHLRQAIFNLRTLPEEAGTLNARLTKWLGEWSALTGVDVEVQLDPLPFTPHDEVLLFGIVQEAFHNIRKHADAHRARLQLTHHPATASWQLTLHDDGRGFDHATRTPHKYGLAMMEERATKLGAQFTIRSHPTGGTELTLIGRRSPEKE